jgi:hypothetical protein
MRTRRRGLAASKQAASRDRVGEPLSNAAPAGVASGQLAQEQ